MVSKRDGYRNRRLLELDYLGNSEWLRLTHRSWDCDELTTGVRDCHLDGKLGGDQRCRKSDPDPHCEPRGKTLLRIKAEYRHTRTDDVRFAAGVVVREVGEHEIDDGCLCVLTHAGRGIGADTDWSERGRIDAAPIAFVVVACA